MFVYIDEKVTGNKITDYVVCKKERVQLNFSLVSFFFVFLLLYFYVRMTFQHVVYVFIQQSTREQ